MPPGTYPQGYDPTFSMFAAIGVIFLVMLIRILRGRVQRRIRVERMWIGPVIFLILTGYLLKAFPPPASVAVWAAFAVAAAAGAVLGWFRAKMTKVTLNIETHQLMSQVTPWGILVILGILTARMGLRYVLTDHMAEWHISAAALTDGFLFFYLGMILSGRLEIFLRCRRILAEAEAAKAAGEAVPETVTEEHG